LPSPSSTASSRPQSGEGALAPYLRAIQSHKVVFFLVMIATVAAAGIWVSTGTKEYEATAQVLINPLPQDNQSFLGLDLLRDSGDPTRTAQTAAALLETREVADAAAKRLNETRLGSEILDATKVSAEGESNVLDVTATGESPSEAARTANAFARSALAIRQQILQTQIKEEIEQLENGPQTSTTPNRISQLEALEQHGDPTLSLASPAEPSDSPIGPSAPLVLILALLAGLAIGTAAVVLLEMAARKVRDEDEATQLYPLPILVRVPLLPRSTRRHPERSWDMPPNIREPFRTLLTQFQREEGGKVVMFTSGSTGDGKTTSSVNLAMAMALAGHSTILIDMDLRKPGVDQVLDLDSRASMQTLLDGSAPFEQSLTPFPNMENLKVLSPSNFDGQDELLVERLMGHFFQLLTEATALAEYVVIDTAPLGEVSDALRIARYVDEMVVVVRPGSTNRANFEVMRDLLERTGDRPTGMLVVGDRTGASSTYYTYGLAQQRKVSPPGNPR
jgi:capsular exopolysaccharide synthesis family protein